MFMRDIREGQTLYFSNRLPVKVAHISEQWHDVGLVSVHDRTGKVVLCGPPSFVPEGVYHSDPRELAEDQMQNVRHHLEKVLDALIRAGEIYRDISMGVSCELLKQLGQEAGSIWDKIDEHTWPNTDREEDES